MWRQLFALQPADRQPLQLQIRTAVVDAILNGTLPAGTPLPSSRGLAVELGISRNTVILSYQQLVADGFLESRERSGVVVAARPAAGWPQRIDLISETVPTDWCERIRRRASTMRNIEKPSDWQSYRYPFVYGQLDPTIFPLAQWRQCCRQALSVLEMRDWAPDRIDEDDPLLIEQIRSRILPRRGIWADPSEIMVTLGAQHALYLLAEGLFDRETVVGIEDPGYPDMRNLATLRSDHVVPVSLDAEGLIPDNRFAACDYVHVTPSHQCPTTVTMPFARRMALLERANSSGTILIEDDYDSETSFDHDPQPALKSLDSEGRVIYVASLSKLLAPGLRLGFIVADAALIRELRALRRLMIRHPPVNNQRSVALFLSLGHYESLVQRLTESYKIRAERMVEALKRHLPDLSFDAPTGGSCVWLGGPDGFDGRSAAAAWRAQGLLFEPGDIFFRDIEEGRRFVRLGYSAIGADRIEPGIELLARAMGHSFV